MKKECNKFKADITDYARGAHQYIKDFDALFNHLRKCKSCLNKLFGLEETFAHLAKHKAGKKSLAELKEMFRPDATVGTPLWLRKGPPPEPKLTKLEGMLQQGIKSYKEGQYPTARILLNIVVKELADDAKLSDADRQLKADAYYHLGLTHEASNNIDGALYTFSRAIELDPADADAHYYRADIYSRYNQLEAALRDYNIAIELNPDHEEARRERGLMFYSTNRLEAAMLDAQALIELAPDNGWYSLLRAMVYEMMGLFPEAVADSARAIELKDELAGPKRDIFAYTVRGRSYGMMSEYGKAIADFTALIKLSPRDANSYFYRGIIYARQSKLAEAIADFRKSLALRPGDTSVAD
jgi:tetratricopeptide (TPR) repeat protein